MKHNYKKRKNIKDSSTLLLRDAFEWGNAILINKLETEIAESDYYKISKNDIIFTTKERIYLEDNYDFMEFDFLLDARLKIQKLYIINLLIGVTDFEDPKEPLRKLVKQLNSFIRGEPFFKIIQFGETLGMMDIRYNFEIIEQSTPPKEIKLPKKRLSTFFHEVLKEEGWRMDGKAQRLVYENKKKDIRVRS